LIEIGVFEIERREMRGFNGYWEGWVRVKRENERDLTKQ